MPVLCREEDREDHPVPPRTKRSCIVALAAAAILAIAGCAEAPQPAAPSAPMAPARPTSPAASTPLIATPVVGIGPIVWTTTTDPASHAPTGEVTAFPDDSPLIIAAARGLALPSGSVVDARWSYNDTSLDAFATKLQTSSPAAQQWFAFTLQRDPATPWPTGTYEVSLALDGTPVQSSAVEVTEPR